MATPFYVELGRQFNDVLNRSYHFGLIKLDMRSKTQTGFELHFLNLSNMASGKFMGNVVSRILLKDYAVVCMEKWNTDNVFATDVIFFDRFVKGLKLGAEATFAPNTGNMTGRLKSAYSNEFVAMNAFMDLYRAGPIIEAATVLKYGGFLSGVNAQIDTKNGTLTKKNLALGYLSKDFCLHTCFDNLKVIGVSFYQRIAGMECGLGMRFPTTLEDPHLDLAVRYTFQEPKFSLHFKVNNKALFGLGFQHLLRPGVLLSLSAAIDGQLFIQPPAGATPPANPHGHKVGLGLELDAQ